MAYSKNKDRFKILGSISTTSLRHMKVVECRLGGYFHDPSLIFKTSRMTPRTPTRTRLRKLAKICQFVITIWLKNVTKTLRGNVTRIKHHFKFKANDENICS